MAGRAIPSKKVKVILWVLLVAVVIGVGGTVCWLRPDWLHGNYSYVPNNHGGCTLVKWYARGENAVIPAEINGLAVTEIGSEAFCDEKPYDSWKCVNPVTVTIPDTVTIIQRKPLYIGNISLHKNLRSVLVL